MEIKSLSDLALVSEVKVLVKEEQNLTLEILKCLREIELRRLYADYRYASLREFAMKELGYSCDEAECRITAMRIIKDIPAAEEKLRTGELTLTHLKLAQNFFNTEKRKGSGEYSKSEKLEFLETLCETSTREAQKIIFQESTAPKELIPDQIKEISQENVELRFIGTEKLKNLIDLSRGLLAHKHPGASLGEIIEMALERFVDELDPSRTKKQKRISTRAEAEFRAEIETQTEVESQAEIESQARIEPRTKIKSQAEIESQAKNEFRTEIETNIKTESKVKSAGMHGLESGNIPVAQRVLGKTQFYFTGEGEAMTLNRKTVATLPGTVVRDVYSRAKNKCENCKSTYALQIDHIKPKGLGGTNHPLNLRLLCRSCNQRQAVKSFGQIQMGKFLS